MLRKQNPSQYLEDLYIRALNAQEQINLTEQQLKRVKTIVNHEQHFKGVYTALISSLTYKILHPSQDVRFHKIELASGYSGRSFDTKFVTPFLKEKCFLGAMKESGWLTRSIEQVHPFTLNFPGKIRNKEVKQDFLEILDDIEKDFNLAEEYLYSIFKISIIEKKRRKIIIINPIHKEGHISISRILDLLNRHFYFGYKTKGASILPVIAFYSIYQCMIHCFERFKGKYLESLSSHNSSDKSSGEMGDIIVKNEKDSSIYEVLEIKFEIKPTQIMIKDAYAKIIACNSIQRYYVLSTLHADDLELTKINKTLIDIEQEHGCQFIINGIFESLKYYLRLLSSTDEFLKAYTKNLQKNSELDYEHKNSWNKIVEEIYL